MFLLIISLSCYAYTTDASEILHGYFEYNVRKKYSQFFCTYDSTTGPKDVQWKISGKGRPPVVIQNTTNRFTIRDEAIDEQKRNSSLMVQFENWKSERPYTYSCHLEGSSYKFVSTPTLLIDRTKVYKHGDGIDISVIFKSDIAPKIQWTFTPLGSDRRITIVQSEKHNIQSWEVGDEITLATLTIKIPDKTDAGSYNLSLSIGQTQSFSRDFVIEPEYIEDWIRLYVFLRDPEFVANIGKNEYFYRACLRMPENRYYYSLNQPKKEHCLMVDCYDSQLTLEHKMSITLQYNDFRQSISKQMKIGNMLKLVWHWSLEFEALEVVQNCPEDYSTAFGYSHVTIPIRDVIGLGSNLYCEIDMVALRNNKASPGENQMKFVNGFQDLLKKLNIMRDTDGDGTFTRANALFFGCAMSVATKGFDPFVYFACEFCAKESTMYDIDDKCQDYAKKGGDVNRPELCKTNFVNLFMCPPKDPCPASSQSTSWLKETDGLVEEFTIVNTSTRPYIVEHITHKRREAGDILEAGPGNNVFRIDRSGTGYVADAANRPRGWFYAYGPLPPLAYSFNRRTIAQLNASVRDVSHDVLHATRFVAVGRTPRLQPISQRYARTLCCWFAFLLQFAAACGATYIVVFAKRSLPKEQPRKRRKGRKKQKS